MIHFRIETNVLSKCTSLCNLKILKIKSNKYTMGSPSFPSGTNNKATIHYLIFFNKNTKKYLQKETLNYFTITHKKKTRKTLIIIK